MTAPDSDPSIDKEPHLAPRPIAADPTEARAAEILAREKSPDAFAEQARHSVFDEPDILPGRRAEEIRADWPCSACGYNLRGLTTGTRCPECGHVELYRPPPENAPSLQALRRREMADPARREMFFIPLVACGAFNLVAGLFGGLFSAIPSWTSALVTGPAYSEFLKVILLALFVEARPQWFRSAAGVRSAALLSAASFALSQSCVALVIPSLRPLPGLWGPVGRFSLCVAVHLACTLVAARGWVEAWQRNAADGRRFEPTAVIWGALSATALHAAYNAACLFTGLDALTI